MSTPVYRTLPDGDYDYDGDYEEEEDEEDILLREWEQNTYKW